eukprot:COSAG05_NODE_2498_length_2979_cov_29.040286_2_plen_60_part_00
MAHASPSRVHVYSGSLLGMNTYTSKGGGRRQRVGGSVHMTQRPREAMTGGGCVLGPRAS